MSILYNILEDLALKLRDIKVSNGYATTVASVNLVPTALMVLPNEMLPSIHVVATGPANPTVDDGTYLRMTTPISLVCFVRGAAAAIQEEVLILSMDVQRKVNSIKSSLPIGYLGIIYDSESYALTDTGAMVDQKWNLIYVEDVIE